MRGPPRGAVVFDSACGRMDRVRGMEPAEGVRSYVWATGVKAGLERDKGGAGSTGRIEVGPARVSRVLVRGVAGSEGTRHRGAQASADGNAAIWGAYGRYGLRIVSGDEERAGPTTSAGAVREGSSQGCGLGTDA